MATAYRFVIDNSQEVPPTAGTASGVGSLLFDPATMTASYSVRITGLSFSGTGTVDAPLATGSHFHNGARGTNGAVVFGQIGPANDANDFRAAQNADGSWTLSGRWDSADSGTGIASFAGALGSTPVGSDAPLYYNTHTAAAPSGLIRGQLVAVADDSANTVTGGADGELMYGLGGDDRMQGNASANILAGNTGLDMLTGGDGNDTLFGGRDADVLYGDAGDDMLSGDRGDDMRTGGAGADRFAGHLGGGADTVTDFSFAEGDRVQLPAGTGFTLGDHDGAAAVMLGDGGMITLSGVAPTSATADYVVFA
jgi:Ca2+-binding RTX toxin-like protein